MKIKLFNEIFPQVASSFTHREAKKIKKEEIVEQVFTLAEDKIVYFFKQLAIACGSKDKTVAKKSVKIFPFLYRVFAQKEAAHTISESIATQIRKFVSPLFVKDPGNFSDWERPLSQCIVPSPEEAEALHKEIARQSAGDEGVLRLTTVFASSQREKFHTMPYDQNRLGRGTNLYLNASVVPYATTGTFILAGVPQKKAELENYLGELVSNKVSVSVSLHQVEDVTKEANFFDSKVVKALSLKEGMTIELVDNEQEIAKSTTITTGRIPRIVLREYVVKKQAQRVHTLYSIHYENWLDHTFVPDKTLLNPLFEVVEKLSPEKAPIAINCRAGIGRTGCVALLLAARKVVQEAIQQKAEPSAIRVNLPKILYALRKGRSGLGTKKQLIPSFQVFQEYARSLIASSRCVHATVVASSTASASLGSSSTAPST